MAVFIIAYHETAKVEGGYSNHPNDTGGETWRGIARKKNPTWPGWVIVDRLRKQPGFPGNLANNSELHALELSFYKSNYWDVLRLDQANNQKNANKLYDISINAGQGFAGKLLQRVLNVSNQRGKYYPDLAVDGKVGPATIAALNKHPRPDVVFKALNVLQGAHYISIGESRESQEDFINGWFMNRIASIVEPGRYENLA